MQYRTIDQTVERGVQATSGTPPKFPHAKAAGWRDRQSGTGALTVLPTAKHAEQKYLVLVKPKKHLG